MLPRLQVAVLVLPTAPRHFVTLNCSYFLDVCSLTAAQPPTQQPQRHFFIVRGAVVVCWAAPVPACAWARCVRTCSLPVCLCARACAPVCKNVLLVVCPCSLCVPATPCFCACYYCGVAARNAHAGVCACECVFTLTRMMQRANHTRVTHTHTRQGAPTATAWRTIPRPVTTRKVRLAGVLIRSSTRARARTRGSADPLHVRPHARSHAHTLARSHTHSPTRALTHDRRALNTHTVHTRSLQAATGARPRLCRWASLTKVCSCVCAAVCFCASVCWCVLCVLRVYVSVCLCVCVSVCLCVCVRVRVCVCSCVLASRASLCVVHGCRACLCACAPAWRALRVCALSRVSAKECSAPVICVCSALPLLPVRPRNAMLCCALCFHCCSVCPV